MSSIRDRYDNPKTSIDIIEKLVEKFSQQQLPSKQSEKRNPYVYKDGPLCLKRQRWVEIGKSIQSIAGSKEHGQDDGTMKLSKLHKEDTVEEKKPSIPMETILLRLGSLNIETDNYQLYSINIRIISSNPQQNMVSSTIPPHLSSHLFGILTPNEMQSIPSFPVYTKSAVEMEVTTSLWHGNVRFREEEWSRILAFHDFIFSDFLNIVEFPMMFSPNNSESCILLVPLIRLRRGSDDYGIDWNLLSQMKRGELTRASSMERYDDMVVIPRYSKKNRTQYYNVVRVCSDMNPMSRFPSDRFGTFREYYKQEFNMEIEDLNQTLLETNLMSENINSIKRQDVNRRGIAFPNLKEFSKSYCTFYHVPELSDIHPIPASLLQQSFYIPAILYRIISLLVADELREVIAKGINGILDDNNAIKVNLSENDFWDPLIFEKTSQTDSKDIRPLKFKFDQQPELMNIKGPSPGMILRCLTTAQAQDAFDVERIKTLGDSFLKYIVVELLCFIFSSEDVKDLVKRKDAIVSQDNLKKLGLQRQLERKIINTTFDAKNKNWLPPCYYVSKTLENALISSPDGIHRRKNILQELLRSNQFDEDIKARMKAKGFEARPLSRWILTYQTTNDRSLASCIEALIGAYLVECGKKGAGLFMQWVGFDIHSMIDGQHKNKASIACESNATNISYYSNQNSFAADLEACSSVPLLLPPISKNESRFHDLYVEKQYSEFEQVIGYTFKNRCYLLQAFTHESYSREWCYERLEFLGDAVLDYLITRYLYQDPKTICSGKISEIRSALVNNAIYAKLAVSKCGFQRYINLRSQALQSLIDRFVELTVQKERYLNIVGDLEEMDISNGLEEIESPKIISDMFESVAGAIYLDSGRKLDTVWNIYGEIMNEIIIEYRVCIPKSPITELIEMFPRNVKYHKTERLRSHQCVGDEKDKFSVAVFVEGKGCFKGIGSTEKIAKITASKLALYQIKMESKSLIEEMEISTVAQYTRKDDEDKQNIVKSASDDTMTLKRRHSNANDKSKKQKVEEETESLLSSLSITSPPMKLESMDDIFPRRNVISTIETALQKYGVCILKGESGIGKSFISQKFLKKATHEHKFKRIFVVNVSDSNIDKSMYHMAQEMGLAIGEDYSSTLAFDKIFKLLWDKISDDEFMHDMLIIFEDAEVKFFMKCYDHAKQIKMLILTKCEEDYIKDFEEENIIRLLPYNNSEGIDAVKGFLDCNHLTVRDVRLYDTLVEKLRGFPLALYQVLNEIKFRIGWEKREENVPIDDVMRTYIDLGSKLNNVYVNNEIDDPHLQIVGMIINMRFSRLIELRADLGKATRELFVIMSYMDRNYLYEEMFKTGDGEERTKDFENSLQVLKDMRLVSYENRENANYPLNRRMRRLFKINGFKRKIIIHPLLFLAMRNFTTISDDELITTLQDCFELIKSSHNLSKKSKVQKKNESYTKEQNNCWNVIGNDPNVKSIAKKFPPRILLSEETMKTTNKMQILGLIDSKHIITYAPNLSRLDKFECPPNMLDDEFIKLVPHFTHVNVLRFFKCKLITDQALLFLAKNWPREGRKVNEIVLYGCEKVTDNGVKQLLQTFRDIKVLILSGKGLTPEVTKYVGRACLRLKRLFLGITGNLWDKNIIDIENVDDDGVKAISEGCKQLTRLNLNHCVKITDKSIQHLAQNSEHLANLDIFGCKKITTDGLIKGQTLREERGFVNLKSITLNISQDEQKDLNVKLNQHNGNKNKSKKTKLYNHIKSDNCCSIQSKFSFPSMTDTIVSTYG